jgi:hypothetical protein
VSGTDAPTVGTIVGPGAEPPVGSVDSTVNVRLVDPGPHPLEVLAVLSNMGCPKDLATEYVEASVLGQQPEVLVAAGGPDAARLAEALQAAGGTVSVEAPGDRVGAPSTATAGDVPAILSTGTADVPSPVSRTSQSRLPAVDVVERYLNAYNAGDQTLLVRCLSPSAVLSDATGVVLVQGADEIAQRMAQIFRLYPDRRVTVLGRLIAGPWVLDHQRTTFGGGSTEETVLCLRVDDGLIARLVLLTVA